MGGSSVYEIIKKAIGSKALVAYGGLHPVSRVMNE
jgi:hypothetical protein